MNIKSSKVYNIIIIAIIISSVLVDYVLVGPYQYISILTPSIGVILIYHTFYEKKSYVLSITAYLVSYFVFRQIIVQGDVYINVLLSIYKTITVILMSIVFQYLLSRVRNFGYKNMHIKDIVNYIWIVLVTTFIGATLNVLPIYLVFDYPNSLFWYGNTWIGYMFGVLIFGSAMNYSMLFDQDFVSIRKILYGLLYLIFLTGVVALMFSELLPVFTFSSFQYLILAMYMVAALVFNFRTIFISNYIVYVCYALFKYESLIDVDLTTELFSIIFVLMLLTAAGVLLKTVFLRYQEKEVEAIKTKESMKEFIFSTNEILRDVKVISSESDMYSKTFLRNMFRTGCSILDKFDHASLFIKKDGYVKFIDSIGYDVDYLNQFDLNADQFDWSFLKPVIVNDFKKLYSKSFSSDDDYIKKYPVILQSIRFTIFYDKEPVAGMSFDITEKNEQRFNSDDLSSYNELSEMINSYYHLFVIQNESNSFKDDIVISFVRALGLYDSYSGKHSEEVAYLALEMSKRLHLDDVLTDRIYWSAIVHDIGKIGIRSDIINKEGALTSEERKEVEKHSEFGFAILQSVEGLKEVALRVKHHHERWDGKGYPSGLKGDQIPLCSQILAVCDAVSAMSRNRTYSKAKTVEKIIEEIKLENGKQFSPRVANAMIEYLEESKLIDYYMNT